MQKITEKEYRNVAFNRTFTKKKIWLLLGLVFLSLPILIPIHRYLPMLPANIISWIYYASVMGWYIYYFVKAQRYSKKPEVLKIKLEEKEIKSIAVNRWIRKNWKKLVYCYSPILIIVIIAMTIIVQNYDSWTILLITSGCVWLFGVISAYVVDRLWFNKQANQIKELYMEAYRNGDLT